MASYQKGYCSRTPSQHAPLPYLTPTRTLQSPHDFIQLPDARQN